MLPTLQHCCSATGCVQRTGVREGALTVSERPHMCATSKTDACSRHQVVDSMMESLYWIGMDQPAKGTILPGGWGGEGRREGRE
jgi:hypothetical protein